MIPPVPATPRFVLSHHLPELVALWHLSRTATALLLVDQRRHARKVWAAREFVKAHPAVSEVGAYKDLDVLLDSG